MPPVIIDGRTLVPAREVFESLGGTVVWESETQRVNIILSGKNIILTINSNSAIVDDATEALSSP